MYNTIVHRFLGLALKLNTSIDVAPSDADTTFVFIHGIGSSLDMWRKTQQVLRKQGKFDRVSFVSVDLLGFGKSPRPDWGTYDIAFQVKALRRTIRPLLGKSSIVVVGHSLGALVAVEYAKKHGDKLDSIVLCSPPFYRHSARRLPAKSTILQRAYEEIANNPKRSEKLLLSVPKYSLINEGFAISNTNAPIFIKTLKSSIMNQTAYDDAFLLTLPTTILSGRLDPVVIDANIVALAKINQYVSHKRIALAAHEISGVYRKELVKTLAEIV